VTSQEDRKRFIRDEFECFVRIGLDPKMRKSVKKAIEQYVLEDHNQVAPPTLYLESRDGEGNLSEVYYIEPDGNQLLRLLEFLHRFSLEDVRLIRSLMRK
jgi:hypothetical protein